MRQHHSDAVADATLGRVMTVAAALLVAPFALLVAASHPVVVATAAVGLGAGAYAGRARTRVESFAHRLVRPGDGSVDPTADPV